MEAKNTVLIIEDDKYMNNILNEFLKSEGIKSDTVFNYKEAIKKIKRKKYFMLILDYNLNGFKDKNGLDVFDFAKELYPEIKGILITAYGNRLIKDMAKQKGILKVLDKPFSFEELAGFLKTN